MSTTAPPRFTMTNAPVPIEDRPGLEAALRLVPAVKSFCLSQVELSNALHRKAGMPPELCSVNLQQNRALVNACFAEFEYTIASFLAAGREAPCPTP